MARPYGTTIGHAVSLLPMSQVEDGFLDLRDRTAKVVDDALDC